MVWMSVISLAIFIWLCYNFITKNKKNQTAIKALFLKIAAGIVLGLIYKYHYKGGDTFIYYQEGATIATYFMDHPGRFFQLFFRTLEIPELKSILVFVDQPRALLFSKIVSVFYLFSGGNYWIIGAFLSLINFFCLHFLVSELNKKFMGVKKASVFAFYFLPTFVFWTSGLLKESLAIGALAVAVAIVIRLIRKQKYGNFPYWIALFISTMLLWELKYFYAAIAIPMLIGILLFDVLTKWKKVHPIFILFVFFVGILIVSNFHYNLDYSRVLTVIYENHQLGLQSSQEDVIHYYNFDGSLYGFLLNMPLAFISGLFRPFIFEVSNPLQILVALENLIIFILLIVAIWKSRHQIFIKNLFVIATLIYVFSLAVLLAFATPNFGTLSRYKVGYWPFFVLLVIVLFFQKKGQPSMKPDL